jgi:hypothetical protein
MAGGGDGHPGNTSFGPGDGSREVKERKPGAGPTPSRADAEAGEDDAQPARRDPAEVPTGSLAARIGKGQGDS